jgi:hypothetical protein
MAWRRRKCLNAHPWCWGSVGLRPCAWFPVGHALLPTKSSRFWNQFTVIGSVPFCFKSFFQVRFASLVDQWSLFVWCAVMRSVVSFIYCSVPPCSYSLFINIFLDDVFTSPGSVLLHATVIKFPM